EAICTAITGTPVAWQPTEARNLRCAREVARAIVTGSRGHYASISDLIGDLLLAGLSKEASSRVLNLAAPLWVDSEAASPLADVAARNLAAKPDAAGKTRSWSTAINGDFVPTFTAGMYLRRAYLPDPATLVNLHGGESELRLEDLIARLRDEVRSAPTLHRVSDAKVDAFLASLTKPHFGLLPPP